LWHCIEVTIPAIYYCGNLEFFGEPVKRE
jgi:hypothetical protein